MKKMFLGLIFIVFGEYIFRLANVFTIGRIELFGLILPIIGLIISLVGYFEVA